MTTSQSTTATPTRKPSIVPRNDPAVIRAQRRVANARSHGDRDKELAARRDLATAKSSVFLREASRLLVEADAFEAERRALST